MPGWGPARGGFRWIPGTDVATLVLLRVSGVDHSRLLARPLSSEGEFLCSTPAETRFSAGPVAPLFSPPLLPPPLSHSVQICPAAGTRPPSPAPAAQTQLGLPTGPSTSLPPPCPSPGRLLRQLELQPAQRAPRARTLAAGVHLRAQSEAAGVGETAGRGSGSLHRLKKTKSKTNTQQMKPACPPGLHSAPLQRTRLATSWPVSRISDRRPQSQWSRRGDFGGICL